jgi:TetR/AcrR family transcriptional regulator, tetracycline repressor protein
MARSAQAPDAPLPAKGEPAASRAPWGSISREEIIRAAVGIVEAGGYEDMSIRNLAAQLGVSPMALYRHIRDKDDLLDEVADILLAAAWRPAAAENDWQAWIIEAAANLREFLVTHPAGLHVYLRHPVVSPAAVERMNAMMGVLRRAGLDEATARSAYGALHTYTIGFAALEASRSGWIPDSGDVSSLAQQLAAYTTTGQFIEGLRYLLAGIGRQAKTGREPRR